MYIVQKLGGREGEKKTVINGSLGRCRYKGQRVSQPHSVPPRHMQTRTSR